MNTRVEAVLKDVAEMGLDGLLLVQDERVSRKNVRYLTGFSGSTAYVLVTPARKVLLADDRYVEQATIECPAFEVIRVERPFTNPLKGIVEELQLERVGYETEALLVGVLTSLQEALPRVEWTPTTGLIERLRATKDPSETAVLARAAEISDQVFDHVANFIRPGVTEKQIAYEFECQARKLGSPGLAFDLIVGSGPRSTHQHGKPTDRQVMLGDFIVMDFGVVMDGYLSDTTRTVVVGAASDEQRRVYDTVKRAQQLGVELMKPGVVGSSACQSVRDVMVDAGYGEWCSSNLGHGVGLEIHEEPFLSPLRKDVVLQPGHLVTVEPGIYIPGWGGVRIEDMVVVEENGPRVLTHCTTELLELG